MTKDVVAVTSYGLNANWLATDTVTTTASTLDGTNSNYANITYDWCAPYYHWSGWHGYSPKIKLGFSEVNRLRKAAKADKNLKAILEKFTDHIEIVMDFD